MCWQFIHWQMLFAWCFFLAICCFRMMITIIIQRFIWINKSFLNPIITCHSYKFDYLMRSLYCMSQFLLSRYFNVNLRWIRYWNILFIRFVWTDDATFACKCERSMLSTVPYLYWFNRFTSGLHRKHFFSSLHFTSSSSISLWHSLFNVSLSF